jgi:hypothetical protein
MFGRPGLKPSDKRVLESSYERVLESSHERVTEPSYEQVVEPRYEQVVEPGFEQFLAPSDMRKSHSAERSSRGVIFLSLSVLIIQFVSIHIDPQVARAEAEQEQTVLNGQVERFEPSSLLGKWNGHIKKFGRHPKLFIESCEAGQIAGVYKGLFGDFPIVGQYDEASGAITMRVDFSTSKVASALLRVRKWKKIQRKEGLIQGKIEGNDLVGSASIPELSQRSVRWVASKDVSFDSSSGKRSQ